MQPARFLLVEINNSNSKRPAVSSGEEHGLLSRTAAGNRAYESGNSLTLKVFLIAPRSRPFCVSR